MKRGPIRSLRAVGGAGALALLVAACSSSASSPSSAPSSSGAASSAAAGSSASAAASGSASAAPSGSPIKIGIITDVGTAVNFPDMVSAAKAAALGINSRGGINGHSVEIDFCNEALDPNKGVACARQLVSDHVMATAGDLDPTSEQTVNSILAQAGIAQVGPATQGPCGTDSNCYLMYPTALGYVPAYAKYAVQEGAKDLGAILLNSPITATAGPALKAVVPQLGATLGPIVESQQGGGNLQPQAATLSNAHIDGLVSDTDGPSANAIIKALSNFSFAGNVYVNSSALTYAEIQALGPLANKLRWVSTFPPVTATSIPGVKQMVSDFKAQAATGDQNVPNLNFTGDYTIQAYVATIAIANIANSSGATDAPSFKKAIDAAKNVSTDGILPPWTPNAAGPKVIPRASDTSFYFFSWNNGSAKLLSQTPTNLATLLNQLP